jgi:hypothetical protein
MPLSSNDLIRSPYHSLFFLISRSTSPLSFYPLIQTLVSFIFTTILPCFSLEAISASCTFPWDYSKNKMINFLVLLCDVGLVACDWKDTNH